MSDGLAVTDATIVVIFWNVVFLFIFKSGVSMDGWLPWIWFDGMIALWFVVYAYQS